MPKSRKTRKEKIEAHVKRQESMVSYSLSSVANIQRETKSQPGNAYAYVTNDIKKTFMVSATLILLQLILFFFLQHRVVVIPGVTY